MNAKPTILLIEDDPDDVMLISDAINEVGSFFDLQVKYDGRSGLNFLREARENNNLPCLVILDINMPLLNGREVLAIMKSEEKLRDIPVVLFTTSSFSSDIVYGSQFGVDLITKPKSLAQLKAIAVKLVSYCNLSAAV